MQAKSPIVSWDEYCSREHVSRETIAALETYERLLQHWSRVINLVSDRTLSQLWLRHFADSLQLRKFVGATTNLIDLGSGAGFPGLVLALDAIGTGARFHLVESDQRKCAFLRAVAIETGAPVTIHCARIEQVIEHLPPADVVTARALKPLDELVSLAAPKLKLGALGVFPKGREFSRELTEFEGRGNYILDSFESLTDSGSVIVTVRSSSSGTAAL